MKRKNKIGVSLLLLIGIAAIIGISFSKIITQDESYHHLSN